MTEIHDEGPLVDVLVRFFEEVQKHHFETYRQRAILHMFLDLVLDGLWPPRDES